MILRIDNVIKTYARARVRTVALRRVTLELGRGELLGLTGHEGSGKTTLLRIAAGLERPDSGSVSYQGHPLDRMSRAELLRYRREEIGCVWGAESLIPRASALTNVAMPLLMTGYDRRTAQERAREALLACRVDGIAGARPHELSDAERQRVALARSIATQPRVLLADEPTASLGIAERDDVLYLLQSLAKNAGVAVLLADTHITGVMRADDIVFLEKGALHARPARPPASLYDFPSGGQQDPGDA